MNEQLEAPQNKKDRTFVAVFSLGDARRTRHAGLTRCAIGVRDMPTSVTRVVTDCKTQPLRRLMSQAEPFDQLFVLIGIVALEVVQQLAPMAHHAQQAAT